MTHINNTPNDDSQETGNTKNSRKNKIVIRSFALPVAVFDMIKKAQRDALEIHGVKLTNSEALAAILFSYDCLLRDIRAAIA